MLVTVKHTSGKGQRIQLSESDSLAMIRENLISKKAMSESDKFISLGYELLVSEEMGTELGEILENGILNIGAAAKPILNTDVNKTDNYSTFTDEEKRALFAEGEIFKGITFKAGDIGFSVADIYDFKNGYMPTAAEPAANTVYYSTYSFSESTRELNLITNDKTTLSLESTYVDANTEYAVAKEKHSGQHIVNEYLLAKYLIRKLTIEMDADCLKPTESFVKEIKAVFGKTNINDNDRRYFLVEVLNKCGAYIPLKFTLGGKIYSKEETQISEIHLAEKEKKDFSASAKAKFAPFSVGGGYSKSEENETAMTNSSKYKSLTIEQTGGATGLTGNPAEFNKSLNIAMNWKIIDIEKFYPSLLLLLDTNEVLLGKCVKLLSGVNDNKELITKIQPYIDIQKYAATVIYYMEQ